jgi:hypothetical protein
MQAMIRLDYEEGFFAVGETREGSELLESCFRPVPRKAIKPGDAYPGLPRLIRLLVLLGGLQEKEEIFSSSTLYRGALVTAVTRCTAPW